MTELRRRMDGDMVVRGMADRTRETYLTAVTGLARYYRRAPDQTPTRRCKTTCSISFVIGSGRGVRATSPSMRCAFCITRR